jgi:hypothetical protein
MEKDMLKKFSSGYKFASPGMGLALICFFLPWVLQSCGNEPLQQYNGLQLAIGSSGQGEGYKGNIFVLLTFVALFVILFFAIQHTRSGSLTARDTYGVLGTSVLVLLILFQQFLTAPSEGVNRQVLYGLWGYIVGWLLILIGGVVNIVERGGNRK